MAQTIAEIKKGMTDLFINNEVLIRMYKLVPGKSFEEQFSVVSLENIIIYIVAVCNWTLQVLFDKHKAEVLEEIKELKPHSTLWYANKAKAFQYGRGLIKDTDQYDNTSLSEEQINEERIVKYSAVTERDYVVLIKVATEIDGQRQPLTVEQVKALNSYFQEIKDAGVKLEIISESADVFDVYIDVYYNPQIFDSNLNRIDGTGQLVHDTIKSYVENLPFNGEYQNSTLIDRLVHLEGVELVNLKHSTANGIGIEAKHIPESGYFKTVEIMNINPIAYEII